MRVKKLLLILTILTFAAIVYAAGNKGPEVIDLSKTFNVEKTTKPAVQFPHALHQQNNQCVECHMSPEGGKELKTASGAKFEPGVVKGAGNSVHKEICWPCHVEKKVKAGKSCNKCHK
jgi:hypothetical protein